jgi:hypothetical protein
VTTQQRAIIAVVFVVAVLGGGALALAVLGGGGATATPSPVAQATEEPTTTASPSGGEPSESPSTAPSQSTTPSPTAAPTEAPTPTPTLPPAAPATVVFTQLKLDAKDDPARHTRRMEWRTAGSGPVKVSVKVRSPRGEVALCLSREASIVDCIHTADGSIQSRANADFRDFAMSVIGVGAAAPVVDVTITFPARAPSVTIVRARFDGTDFPETNGIQVLIQPRRPGDIKLDAEWGEDFRYEVDLFEQGGDGRSQEFPNEGPASGVQQVFPVTTTSRWKLVLQNIEPGDGSVLMNATIAWP